MISKFAVTRAELVIDRTLHRSTHGDNKAGSISSKALSEKLIPRAILPICTTM